MRRIAPSDVAAALRRALAAPRALGALAHDPMRPLPLASEAGSATPPALRTRERE
jgi:hypothetical protein